MAFVGVGSVGSHLRGSGLRWEGLERRNGGIRAMTAPTVSLRGRVGLRMAADEFDDLAAQMAKDLGLGGATDAPESEGNLPVVVSAEGGLPAVVLEHKATKQEVTVYLMGATVQSWKVGEKECFFTSDVADFSGKKAIRAGIPICFPQFGPYGDLPTHGFARVTNWEVKTLEALEDGSAYAVLTISSSTPSDLIAQWSGSRKWEAEYAITLSATGLETALRVKNTGSEPIEFTAALHNYFSVADVNLVRVFGLDKTTYKDRLDGDKIVDSPDDMGQGTGIEAETDRIYRDVTQDVAVFDMTTLRLYKIRRTETFSDATLWNPYGGEGADPGWKSFVCVEPAVIDKPAVVAPGEEWVGAQLLNVEL